MKLFLMYMKNKASTIIQLLSLCIVFFIVFWLYNVPLEPIVFGIELYGVCYICVLYTSDAADEGSGVYIGGGRIIK